MMGKGAVPPPDADGAAGGTTYNSSGGSGSRFVQRSPEAIFSDFFGGVGNDGMRGSSSSGSMFGDSVFGSPFGGSVHQSALRKASPIEENLPCTLEELYKGTNKEVKISREIVDVNGKSRTVEETLTINVKPGWKKGTKITYPEKGNVIRGVIPADLVFIIDEKPHRVFTRDGNDLIVTQKISLTEALTGCTVHLTTLDGRSLNIPIIKIVLPTCEEVVHGGGMPLPKDPSEKGNLRIKFDIKYPAGLTASQKSGIKELLGP